MRAAAKALDTEKVGEVAKASAEAKAKAKAKAKGKPGRPKGKAKAKAQAGHGLPGDVKADCSGDTDLEEEDAAIKAEMDLDMDDQGCADQPGSDQATQAPKGQERCRKAESMSESGTALAQDAPKMRKCKQPKSTKSPAQETTKSPAQAHADADNMPPPKAESGDGCQEATGNPSSSHNDLPAPAPKVDENDATKQKQIQEEVAKIATPQAKSQKEENPKSTKRKKPLEWRCLLSLFRHRILFNSFHVTFLSHLYDA